ncbi:MAG: leucyl aminopeptidase [Chromatocurvus sp.]
MPKLSVTARTLRDGGSARTQCAILPVFAKGKLQGVGEQLDAALNGVIRSALAMGDFSGAQGKTLLLPGTGDVKRVLLVGLGSEKKFDRVAQRSFCDAASKALKHTEARDALALLNDLPFVDEDDAAACCEELGRALIVQRYHYTETVSKKPRAIKLAKLSVSPPDILPAARARRSLEVGIALGSGINTARELGNLPGNICTPEYLAKEARKLARQHTRVTSKILNEKQMAELGMGSLLSVSAGSDRPARLIVLEYKGGKRGDAPQVLVGKGITFDSGGISLKPGAKMDEMKYDMCGAASVLGTLEAVCELGLEINVVGIIAAAENMPSGRATKPGDVVTSMAGKTIEVLNTDAEGRLVLCDALTYAERFKPAAVIDMATLTGACVVALGSHASALYANNEALAEQLLKAGTDSHDRAWRMPLWDEYRKQLHSNFADLANIGGPEAGSITAACFLAQFAGNYPWAHLDIAGAAWNSSPKGATGRPVGLLLRYLQERAGAQ